MATSAAKQQPKRVFGFDLHKPLFKGNLLKQGEFHRAFKDRFFVLYPGFLVYYDTITTWQYDLQRGETLGGRVNAVKLRGGNVEKAKSPPKGAKHAFVLHAPDKSNKRYTILLNAKSSEERYQWMCKIKEAIVPNSSKTKAEQSVAQPGKDTQEKQEEIKKKDEELKEEQGVGKSTEDEPKNKGVSDSTTSEKDTSSNAVTPSAAEEEQTDSKESNHQEDIINVPEDMAEESTEAILGPRDNVYSSSSNESGGIDLDESSPEPETNESDDVAVVSSATVEIKNDVKTNKHEDQNNTRKLTREETLRTMETSETVVSSIGPKLSITITNGGITSDGLSDISDNDDEDSDEDSDGIELPVSPAVQRKDISAKQNNQEVSSPDTTKSNGSSSPNASSSKSNSQPTPQISVDAVEEDRERQPDSTDPNAPVIPSVIKKDEFTPTSPTPDRRRPSGVSGFIEKRGYLYKQGGKHKSWHLRYFVLQPGVFTYFKNDPKGKVLGEVKLSKRVKIFLPKPGEKKYSSYQFTVYSPSDWNKRSTYTMSANNESEMKDWIEAFKLGSGLLREDSIRSTQ